jgi:plastocyanin
MNRLLSASLAMTLLAAPALAERRKPAAEASDKADKADKAADAWAGEAMPLTLAVKTPEDLALKAEAEKQYLLFNLLAGGKRAWDAGDFATAAAKWEALLRLPSLPASTAEVVKPYAEEARKRVGGAPNAPVALTTHLEKPEVEPEHKPDAAPKAPSKVTVKGSVSGGGALGPGGAVVWLERVGGGTPAPKPAKDKVIRQIGKAFVPKVLAVPVGTEVAFRNEDELFHNVFSLTKPRDFDLGLYQGGNIKTQTFSTPGPVQLLCNIHSSMLGWVYVVNSPYYAQADSTGAFTIHGVPPGAYTLKVWHESASKPTEQPLTVGDAGSTVQVAVGGDVKAPTFVPDKAGKLRQVQLGY